MKKIVVLIALVTLPLIGFSQSAFDKFEDMEEVSTVVVNQNMFKLFSRIESDDPEAQEFMEMVKSLNDLKVFITEDESVGAQMKATVDKYLKNASLQELMRVKDKEVNVKFYIKQGRDEDHVSELLMFVSGLKDMEANGRKFETVLLSLTGDIDLNKISTLTRKMNLPSELEKADKKNKN
ncbi:DUF4252 domain-containing protein [Flavobacteriaceae bacterium M23B6Z8]